MARVNLKGIHRITAKLADGSSKEYHYAWRGGPKFWDSDSPFEKNTPEYLAALASKASLPKPESEMTPTTVDAYLDNAAVTTKAPRTQADYRKWALRFAEAFKDDPIAMFTEPESRGEVVAWCSKWNHSPRQHDEAVGAATRFLNWAVKSGKLLQHHCHKLPKYYEVDRSEIVWTAAHQEAVGEIAPEWVRRLLGAACETGLRVGDLIKLNKNSVETTPKGRRLRVRTNKRKRLAHIPVTPQMAEIIDSTPDDRFLILVNASGGALTPHRASEGLRQWRDKAKLSPDDIGYDLRLQDTRGTAATRLLNSGLSLAEIANHMGWSVRYAANVIEHYARVSPDETDAVLVKLAQHRRGAT